MREMVILGTEYAGEMKKGIFTVLNYVLPKQDILSMHCSANVGAAGDTALFFGLSGTGPRFQPNHGAVLLAMMNTGGAIAVFSILRVVVTPSVSVFRKRASRRFTMRSVLGRCSKMSFLTRTRAWLITTMIRLQKIRVQHIPSSIFPMHKFHVPARQMIADDTDDVGAVPCACLSDDRR